MYIDSALFTTLLYYPGHSPAKSFIDSPMTFKIKYRYLLKTCRAFNDLALFNFTISSAYGTLHIPSSKMILECTRSILPLFVFLSLFSLHLPCLLFKMPTTPHVLPASTWQTSCASRLEIHLKHCLLLEALQNPNSYPHPKMDWGAPSSLNFPQSHPCSHYIIIFYTLLSPITIRNLFYLYHHSQCLTTGKCLLNDCIR